MKKERLSRILSRADRNFILNAAAEIQKSHSARIIKGPAKTLMMIKMREPVRESLFYMGEVLVTECILDVDGVRGMAVTMGDDSERTVACAVIDAAFNAAFPEVQDLEKKLIDLEARQLQRIQKENALFHGTEVNFSSMDSGGDNGKSA